MKLPQLSLRDLFWLVLVAACLCGWLVERRQLTKRIEELENPEFDFRFAQETFNSPYPWGFSGPAVNTDGKP